MAFWKHASPTLLAAAALAILFTSSSTTNRLAGSSPGNTALSEIKVPEGFTVEVAAGPELVDYPMFATLDETGRLFVFESIGHVYKKTKDAFDQPQFRIKLLTDSNGDGKYDKATVFADKVRFPQGGVFYQGSLYASSAPDLIKFTDTDNDGVADKQEVLLTGWTLNVNANSLIGPFLGPAGWLYLTSAIMGFDVTTKEGKRLKGGTSRIWRTRPDGTGLEWISAGGMNNPVELTFTEAGETIGTETYFTDPVAGQRDALVYWTEGGVYPKPNKNIDRDSLVRTGELMPVVTKYSRVAPSGIGRYRHTAFGPGYQDNLFSAQFNTHRILRHKLIREGGSFNTEDEVFFSSESEDSHPTDVLEAGDGSLLVVETGGWFIQGCPLSQVSKPELKGAIYRVRRKAAPSQVDPYGNRLNWSTLTPEKLTPLLADARPFVQDRASQQLIDRGAAAVGALTQVLKKAPSADVRTRAVFALHRIGNAPAREAVRSALSDADLQVRVAAARAVGLARDKAAVGRLQQLITTDLPAVRRQAATALGQMGATEAVPALLAAAGKTSDRFVNHALIYALITLNQPQPVAQALSSPSPAIREAALIALDQMPASSLSTSQVIPFLQGKDHRLQRTALWVASRHPGWAEAMATFLNNRLQQGPLSAGEEQLYSDLLVSFSGNATIQRLMETQLESASADRQRFVLAAMARYPAEKFPEPWVRAIGKQLVSAPDPQVQDQSLSLITLRNLRSLAGSLREVANDPNRLPRLRVGAIGALTKAEPGLSDTHFGYLYQLLTTGSDAPLRQQVAMVLTQGKLTETQLRQLATDYLPRADAFMLPRILPVFQGAHSAATGKALITTLAASSGLDSFSEETLKALFQKYPDEIRPEVDGLMKKLQQVQAGRLQRLQAMESLISQGNLDRGRALFFGKGICYTCHKVGMEGGKLGPDLTSIQRDRSAHDLLEAIVYPNVSFVREYETYRIRTKAGEHLGILQEQNPTAIVLGTAPGTSVRISRADILSMEMHDTSMMPQGLDQLLSRQEMADLLAFLLGQDQDPDKDQAVLRKALNR